jgi:hypothetical protein
MMKEVTKDTMCSRMMSLEGMDRRAEEELAVAVVEEVEHGMETKRRKNGRRHEFSVVFFLLLFCFFAIFFFFFFYMI